MAPFPIQGIVRGDFVVHLVAVDDQDPMSSVADQVAHHAIGRRLPDTGAPLQVFVGGRELPASITVAESGLQPLDVVEVAAG
ncbi:toluene-4-monooxygenase system B family protein [Pseudonocardia benzenivorans]|uniref:Toluene-4-monooxygenase system B family protein n=1 Tax=Pseudonocardia benzenivorans TaxID=228005 RepID=A0ABW3VBH9_9PSEU